MFTLKKAVAFATPAVLAATTLTVAASSAAETTSTAAAVECEGNVVSLVVRNGSNQYFECGTVRQTFESKNPWVVDPAAPAIFLTPPATPDGAFGQIFTGRVQGVGVISSDDNTGSERDSISRNETLTLQKDLLDRNFTGLQLGVNVLEVGTVITVQPVDPDGSDLGSPASWEATDTGPTDVPFFTGGQDPDFDTGLPVDAAGFKLGVSAGAFSLDGDQTTEFYLEVPDTTPPGPVTDLMADPGVTSVDLSWMVPNDEEAEVIIRRAEGSTPPATIEAGTGVTSTDGTSATDSGLTANTEYSYSVFRQDAAGNTSTAATVTTTTKPQPVTGLQVVAEEVTSVALSWTNPTPAPDEIIVRRGAAGGAAPAGPTDGTGVGPDPLTSNSVVDTGLMPGTTYKYSVFTQYGTNVSDPETVTATTDPGITDENGSNVEETFGDQTIRSEVDFVPTDSCNADAIPFVHDVLSFVDPNLALYTLAADWVVPDKDDTIPAGETNEGDPYGSCLFRWTTTAIGVDFSLTPLMDYDGPEVTDENGTTGNLYEPEAIPGCEYDASGVVYPPVGYGTPEPEDRPFCLESDSFDGATATKTTTVLVWNDPRRFT